MLDSLRLRGGLTMFFFQFMIQAGMFFIVPLFLSVALGLLVSEGQAAFKTRPHLFYWPGFMIILIALSVNFVGDGLRDAFDPRQKRVRQ